MKTITVEELNRQVINAVLNNNKTALRALSKVVVRSTVVRCAECGSTNMQDNGAPSASLDYTTLCVDCGDQHCPNM